MRAVPDMSTLTAVPWEPGVSAVIADLQRVRQGSRRADGSARGAASRRRASSRSSATRRSSARARVLSVPGRRQPAAALLALRRPPRAWSTGRPAGGSGRPGAQARPRRWRASAWRPSSTTSSATASTRSTSPGPGAQGGRPRLPPEVGGQGPGRARTGSSRPSWASRSRTRAAPAPRARLALSATARTRSSAGRSGRDRPPMRSFLAGVLAPCPRADGPAQPDGERIPAHGAGLAGAPPRTGAGATGPRWSGYRRSAAGRRAWRSASATAAPTHPHRRRHPVRRLHGGRESLPLQPPVAGDVSAAAEEERGVRFRARSRSRWRRSRTTRLPGPDRARAHRHVRRAQALRDRASPRIGLRLGDRRVPPAPVRRRRT